MNEIEYFKRWSSCYLQWSHSNFDRIAKDVIERHKDEMEKEILEPIHQQMRELLGSSNKFIKQYDDIFAIEGAKIGSTLKIRMPSDWQGTFPSSPRSSPIPLMRRVKTWLRLRIPRLTTKR